MSPSQQWGGGGGWGPQPPGGGAPPGGGGLPPPGGGALPGDAPLGSIPFSPEDRRNISQTAMFMRLAGALALLSGVFSTVGTVAVWLYRGADILGPIVSGVLGLFVQAALGAMLFVSASAFSKIVVSDGADQHHLASGLRQLRWYFLTKAIIWALLVLGCCLCIGVGVIFGAAFFAMVAGAMSH